MATYRTRTARDGTVSVHTMVRLAGYPTRTASFPSKREAQKWAATVEAEMIEGRHFKGTEGRKRTLTEAITRYRAEVIPQKRNGSMYGFTLDWWEANHGGKKLGEITRGWLADARLQLLTGKYTRATPGSKRSLYRVTGVDMAKPGDDGTTMVTVVGAHHTPEHTQDVKYYIAGTMTRHAPEYSKPQAFQRTPATANRYMAALSHVFTMVCGDWEWLAPAGNPFTGLSKLKEAKGRTRHLSDDERARLLTETAKDPQLHVLVQVALATAARAGELTGLVWACVELGPTEGRLLFTDTKNGEARIAWVFGDAFQALTLHARRLLGVDKPSSLTDTTVLHRCLAMPVFPGRWSHSQGRYGKYDYMPRLRKALTASGITNFRFHDLRHTAATGLAKMGASSQQLRSIAGWKSNTMADRYVHIAAEDTKALAQKYAGKITQEGK